MSTQPNQGAFPGVELEGEWIKADQFDPKTWAAAVTQRRSMGAHVPGYGAPVAPTKKLEGPRFIGADEQRVAVNETANPDFAASVGFAGSAVVVESQSTLVEGHLFIPTDGAEEKGIAADTIRVFRWASELKAFQIVLRSGSRNDVWAWAEISTPGIYVPIGLPRDPIASRLLKIGWILSDLASTRQEIPGDLLKEIGSALFNGLEPVLQDLDQIPKLRGPGAPNPDLPTYSRTDNRVNPGTVIDALSHSPRPPEYQILANPSTLTRLQDRWEFVGPQNIAGMSLSVVLDPNEPDQIYTATASGGVRRLSSVSDHPSSFWELVTDGLPSQRTQAFAVATSDVGAWYVQMNNGWLYRHDSLRATWSIVNRDAIGNAWRILVDPNTADRVYVATTTGLWRSDNGGRTWATGGPLTPGDATDVALDPVNPDVIYVAIRGVGLRRSFVRGRPDSWSTVLAWDSGHAYWTDPARMTTALRIALGVSGPPSARRIVAKFGQEVFYNSSGGNGAWGSLGMVGGPQPLHGAGYDFGQGDWAHGIAIDPFDENLILAAQDMLYRRRADSNAGWEIAIQYFTPLEQGHADYHGITFDPAQEGVVYVANDGGVYRSDDHGGTWRSLADGLNTLQFWFHTGISGGALLGGAYHHGLIGAARPENPNWQVLSGGAWEFSSAVSDAQRPGTFYVFNTQEPRSGMPRATLTRMPHSTSVTLELDLEWATLPGATATDPRVTFNTAAAAMDPRPGVYTMLAGGRTGLYRTVNRLEYTGSAPIWTLESLTLDSGDSIVSLAYSTTRSGAPPIAYALTARALVYRNMNVDGGGAWERRGQWPGADAREIAVNPYDPQRIYVVAWNAGVALSPDGGATFPPIAAAGSGPFPAGSNYNSILPHPNAARTLILATTFGIYISTDEGGRWRQFGVGLPDVHVVSVFVYGQYLYAATHGCGLWRHSLT